MNIEHRLPTNIRSFPAQIFIFIEVCRENIMNFEIRPFERKAKFIVQMSAWTKTNMHFVIDKIQSHGK